MNKSFVELIKIVNIEDTFNCGLAKVLRKRLHRAGIRNGFKAVFSFEDINTEAIIIEAGLNKKTNVGTISYMPGIFGMFCASVAINHITEN